jgi:hypothetical protein
MVKAIAYGIIKDGQLTIANQRRFKADLAHFKNCAVEITIKKRNTRSSPQNRYLWGVVYKEVEVRLRELGNDVNPEVVHEYCKGRFNKVEIIGEGGDVLDYLGGSTTEMNKEEFGQYVDRIIEWAASFLSIAIPLPNADLQLEFK